MVFVQIERWTSLLKEFFSVGRKWYYTLDTVIQGILSFLMGLHHQNHSMSLSAYSWMSHQTVK
jgi:hypothetical protein